MNAARLFLEAATGGDLLHVRSAASRTRRTRAELLASVTAFCAALRELGVTAGDTVLILCSSRVEAVETILATFNIGAVAVPLAATLGAGHLREVIERMRPKCCVFEDPPEPAVGQALAECCSFMVSLKAAAPGAAPREWRVYDELLGRYRGERLAFPSHPLEHPALVIHGSGSSGKLKAVVMSHGALVRFFEYHDFVYSQYSDRPDSLVAEGPLLTGLPLHHLAGLATCLQGLMNGRRTFLLSFFLPEIYLRLMEEERCPLIMLVPSLYRSLLKEPYLERMDKSALRFCITGGEACPPELAAQIESGFGVPLVTAYSMTECLSGIGHSRHDLFNRRIKRASCGKQLFGELSLRDEHGREQPELGELWVRNATVRACYLDPPLNAERLQGGWFRTGDRFYRDADGDFFHRGRVDDMFICNGKNIYPLEMELLLLRHPAVESVCAAPVTLAEKGAVPAAVIVAREPVSAADIQQFAMCNGASHAVPQVVRFVESLPVVGPGKVDRQRVMHMLQQMCAAAPA